MLQTPLPTHSEIEHGILERVMSIVPRLSARAAELERARQISRESVHELLDAGIARTLVPRHFGGYGLGIEAWFDVVREISRADASHGWCASIIIHHAHVVGCFPEEAQEAVWTGGPDVAIAASIMPTAQISPTEGGYFVTTQQSAFASGVGHSSWAIVGGLVQNGEASDWTLFLVPAGEFQIKDTWFTTGMCGTGSNTIIIPDRVFVPKERTLRVADLRDGNGPGAATNGYGIYQLPFGCYAGLAFATPMLGATEGRLRPPPGMDKNAQGSRRCSDGREIPASRFALHELQPTLTPQSYFYVVRHDQLI